jgi:RNA polymerase sigma-70 factor, ECF subfamily
VNLPEQKAHLDEQSLEAINPDRCQLSSDSCNVTTPGLGLAEHFTSADSLSSRQSQAKTSVAAQPQSVQEGEALLIQRICAGEKELFYDLIRPYERAVYVAALSVLQNESDAEEVAQEAVLKAFANLSRFRGEAKFSTWLIQITINEARMRYRKDRAHLYESIDEKDTDPDGDYFPKDYADWREIPSECLERKELRQALLRGIASLGTKYREVFILRDVQNMSIADTAKSLNISEANVKTRLLRARLMMRDVLAPGIDGVWSLGENSWKKVRPW